MATPTVEVPCEEHGEFMTHNKLPKTLMGGTLAMREMGEEYLPKEDAETPKKYTARLKRTVLLNIFKRTVTKLLGEVFSRPIVYNEELSSDIKEYFKDIDRKGNKIDVFAYEVLKSALVDGATHIFVDYPPTDAKTVSEANKQGVRPYFIHIKSKDLIGWRTEIVSGQQVLRQIRFRENTVEPDGPYSSKIVERVRVIMPDKWELWEKKDNEFFLVEEGPFSLGFIPMVTLRLGEPLSTMTARSPLEDLAWLNLQHWQSASDQRNILHYARLVTWFGRRLDADDQGKVVFGANRLIHSSDPDADLKTVEHNGNAINSGRQDLKDLEEQMALFGLSLLLPRGTSMTATQKTLDNAENDSVLKGYVRLFNAQLDKAVEYMGKWVNNSSPGTISINTDFKTPESGLDIQNLVLAYQEGILSREVVFNEMRERGLIAEDLDFKDMIAQINNERSAINTTFNDLAGSILHADKGNARTPKSQKGREAPAAQALT